MGKPGGGKKGRSRNVGVGVDFRKVKHKVGKKLAPAANETRTDFSARAINLPAQASLAGDKGGEAVSGRNLTLKELLAQAGHHNGGTRRDALTGLQQLLAGHPGEARRHTATLFSTLAPRLADAEGGVRAALLPLLRGALLPPLGQDGLAPFLPLLCAHVAAALTHLSADVRGDALAVLEAVTEAAPALMGAPQQLGDVLGLYCGLLSRSHRGRSVKAQALGGLSKVVASLTRFLTAAGAAAPRAAAAPHDAASSGGDGGGAAAALPPLAQRATPVPPGAAVLPTPAALLQLYCSAGSTQQPLPQQQQQAAAGGAGAGKGAPEPAAAPGGARQLQGEVLALLAVLFECWAEAAPGSLHAAPEQEAADVLVSILSCCQVLLGRLGMLPAGGPAVQPTAAAAAAGGGAAQHVLCPGFNSRHEQQAWLQQAAAIVLPRLLRVFPVVPSATAGVSASVYELLQRFNLLSMQLLAGFMAAGVTWPVLSPRQRQQQQQQQQVSPQEQEWQQRLLGFMAAVLTTGTCLPTLEQQQQAAGAAAASAGSAGSQARRGDDSSSGLSSRAILVAVLESCQQLLPHLDAGPRQLLLAAVGRLAAAGAVTGGGASAGSSSAQELGVSPAAAGAAGSNAVRTACLQLQLQLMLRHLDDARGQQQQPHHYQQQQQQQQQQHEEEQAIASWLAAAPKLLWELGTDKPRISHLLLQLLFEASRRSGPACLSVQEAVLQLQPQLAPLLVTALPPRGGSSGSSSGALPVQLLMGPLVGLPLPCQLLAFDMLAHQQALSPPLLKAAVLACRVSAFEDAAVQRLVDGLMAAAPTMMPPQDFLSLAATLLSAAPAYVDRRGRRALGGGVARHRQLVDAVARGLHGYAALEQLLPLLAAPLLEQWRACEGGAQQAAQEATARQCLAYSLASLAALSAGCWVPSGSVVPKQQQQPVSAGTAVPPPELLAVLPGALAALCSTSSGSDHGGGDEFAAEALLASTLQQQLLPLAAALPDELPLPLLQQLVGAVDAGSGASDDQQQHQHALRVAVQVAGRLLQQQPLRPMWLRCQSQMAQLLARLHGLAAQRQEAQAADEVTRLQTALAVMCDAS